MIVFPINHVLSTCRATGWLVALGNGQSFIGTGYPRTYVGPVPLVYAGSLALSASVAADAALCRPGTLRAAVGKIVVSVARAANKHRQKQ